MRRSCGTVGFHGFYCKLRHNHRLLYEVPIIVITKVFSQRIYNIVSHGVDHGLAAFFLELLKHQSARRGLLSAFLHVINGNCRCRQCQIIYLVRTVVVMPDIHTVTGNHSLVKTVAVHVTHGNGRCGQAQIHFFIINAIVIFIYYEELSTIGRFIDDGSSGAAAQGYA